MKARVLAIEPINHPQVTGKFRDALYIPYNTILLTSVFIWASAMTYYDFP